MIRLVAFVFTVLASFGSIMTTNRFFGDSLTVGGNPDPALAASWPYTVMPWPHIVGAQRGESSIVHALSGNTVVDQAPIVYAYAPAVMNRHFYMAGKADLGIYGAGSGAIAQFRDTLSALTYWLAADKVLMTSPSWTLTGTWFANAVYSGLGIGTQHDGATLTISVTGDVFTFQQTVSDANSGAITVTSDGVLVGTFPCSGMQTLGISGRSIFAPSLRRITGLGTGAHVVKLTAHIPNPAGIVMVDYAVGPARTNGLQTVLLTQPYSRLGDDAQVDLYNAVVRAIPTQAQSDGLNLILIDVSTQRYQLTADGVHLRNVDNVDIAGIAVSVLGH